MSNIKLIFGGLTIVVAVLIFGIMVLDWGTADAGRLIYCASEMEPHNKYRYTYTGDGPNDIDEREGCADNKPVVLEAYPAVVTTSAMHPSDRVRKALPQAIKLFNQRAGCEVFKYEDPAVNAHVSVWRQPKEVGSKGHEGAATSHYQLDKGQFRAHVDVYNVPLDVDLERALMHELGHVAGLAHDSFKDSLMWVSSSGSSRLTDDDVKLLQEHCR